MRKYFFTLILFASILIFIGCTKNVHSDKDTLHYNEAKAIADTLWDADKLKIHINYYDSIKEERSVLLLQQKYGTIMRNKSKFDVAVQQHKECIQLATKLKDTIQLIIALNNQGTNYRRIGDIKEAIKYHYQALELCDKKTNDTTYITRKNRVRTLNGLGNIMLSTGNLSVAENLFRRALQGERELKSHTGQAINLANIGAIKERNDERDSARIYYNLSMQHNVAQGNKVGIALCYQNIGELDEAEGNLKEARANYLKSYEIGAQTKDVWHWLNPCTALANLAFREGKFAEAQTYNNQAIEAATRIQAKGRLAHLYTQRAAINEAKGNYKEAYQSTQIARAYEDSANIEESRIHVENIRINYEIKKRADELKQAKAEAINQKRIRNIILWISISTLLIIIIAVIILFRASLIRKHANEALKKINHERNEFYRGITHQLRTPLTILLGMTKELKKHIPQDNIIAHKEFEAIERKSTEFSNLVTEMIEYNKGNRRKVTISELSNNNQASNVDYSTLIDTSIDDSQKQEYILVAEDNHDVALLITQMLKSNGYKYKWAEDGEVAYSMILEELPHMLITDIMMPNLNGLELIKRIRNNEECNHLPIIVVSARTDNNDRLAGFDAGAEVYIGKPFNPDELLLCIHKLLEQRDLLKKKYSSQIEDSDLNDNKEMYVNCKKSDQEFIQRIDEFIHKNITDRTLNATILASYMAMSITTLNRKINSVANTNTTNYIRMRRLSRAKYLLQNTEMTMGEIQAVCGFESPSYFSRAFKSEYNISPTEFRKTNTN